MIGTLGKSRFNGMVREGSIINCEIAKLVGRLNMTSEQKEREALKPCPMCGGKADYNWDEVGPEATRHWYIHCAPDDSFKGCIAHDGRFATLREATKHWNTRAHQAQPEGELVKRVAMAILDKLVKMEVPLDMGKDITTLAKAALSVISPQPDAKPACATCNDSGEIGGYTGQTAESFGYSSEPCPACIGKPAEQAGGLTEESTKLLREYLELAGIYDDIFNDHELEERAMFRDLFSRTRALLAAMAKKAESSNMKREG